MSPWRTPRCKGKYWVVMPPFITHDFWLFNNASTQETKFLPKPKFFKTTRINLLSSESSTVLMSVVTKCPPVLLRSYILTISDINIPPSPINLFLIYAVCCVEIELERTLITFWEHLIKKHKTYLINRSPIFNVSFVFIIFLC